MEQVFNKGASIAVIGAGIIGVSSAFELSRLGFKVWVFDPLPPGTGGPSRCNAGHIAGSDIHPLSTPGIALRALKMLFLRDSPLRVPGMEKIRVAPWLLQFIATVHGQRFRNASTAITHLSRLAIPEMEQMLSEAGIADKLLKNPGGFIYDSDQSFGASQANWQKKLEAGFQSHPLHRSDIARLLPDINPNFTHAMVSHNWIQVSDPLEIVTGVAKAARDRGVIIQSEAVTKLIAKENNVTLVTETGPRIFDAVVVAAGVHSRPFAATLGENLPLVAERGYNLTFPDPGFELKMPLVLANRGIVVTQVSKGLRFGGWAEFAASPGRPEDKRIYKALTRISLEIFPRLNQAGAIPWMGNRPSLPDSVPVISRSQINRRVFYNCGHGHYGLSFSAASAKILSRLIKQDHLSPKEEAYSIARFN
jgi:D-amino-acid dehydrogenase